MENERFELQKIANTKYRWNGSFQFQNAANSDEIHI